MGSALKKFIDAGLLPIVEEAAAPAASRSPSPAGPAGRDRRLKGQKIVDAVAAAAAGGGVDPAWAVDDYVTLRVEVMTLGPRQCAEILATRNTRNRGVTLKNVLRFARLMRDGRWRLNGETIVFGGDGVLLDGQTRLHAAVQANVPLEAIVVFGIDPDAFDTIDKGKARTKADDLSVVGEVNTTALAAALSLVWLEENDSIENIGHVDKDFDALEVLGRHPDLRAYVDWAKARGSGLMLTPRVGSYLFYRFARIDAKTAETFFEDLVSGAGLARNDPVLQLRKRLTDNLSARAKLPLPELLALTIKAWNARRTGIPVQVLRWRTEGTRSESFPVPV